MILKRILIFIAISGTMLLIYSLFMPYYTSDADKEALDTRGQTAVSQADFAKFKVYYYRKLDDLKTNKVPLMDLALGMMVASLTIQAALVMMKVRRSNRFKKVRSLSKPGIVLLANIMWLLQIPGAYWYYLFRNDRGDYPWFADNIYAPVGNQVQMLLMGWVAMNMLLLILSYGSKFPVLIFVNQAEKSTRTLLWDLFWSLSIMANTALLIRFVIDGDHISIVVNLFFTYLLLTLRAGKINAQRLAIEKRAELHAELQITALPDTNAPAPA